LSCGPGSTTSPNGGPQGNSLECVFATPVTMGSFVVTGTVPWPNSVTFTPFASADNETYVTLPPVTIMAAAPVQAPATTQPPAPDLSSPPTSDTGGHAAGSSLYWLPVVAGLGLVGVDAWWERERRRVLRKEMREWYGPDAVPDDEEPVLHTAGVLPGTFTIAAPPPEEPVLHTAGVLPGTYTVVAPCAAERAAVAAAQAAVAAAQHEFDQACAGLDEAERQNNAPLAPIESGGPLQPADVEFVKTMLWRGVTEAASRQGAARLNLDVARSRLTAAEQALNACLSS
jgi:hypothetical protein